MGAVDTFAEFASAVVRQVPRGLPGSKTQPYVQDQGLLACVLRSALLRNSNLAQEIERIKIYDYCPLNGSTLEKITRYGGSLGPGLSDSDFLGATGQVPSNKALLVKLRNEGKIPTKVLSHTLDRLDLRIGKPVELPDFLGSLGAKSFRMSSDVHAADGMLHGRSFRLLIRGRHARIEVGGLISDKDWADCEVLCFFKY